MKTMTQIRKEIKERKAFAVRMGIDLADWYDDISRALESLWTNGFIADYEVSTEVLKLANGYQINSGNYSTCHINQTFDLRSIKMDKATVKEFGEFILH